jgi:hypothetical protein
MAFLFKSHIFIMQLVCFSTTQLAIVNPFKFQTRLCGAGRDTLEREFILIFIFLLVIGWCLLSFLSMKLPL